MFNYFEFCKFGNAHLALMCAEFDKAMKPTDIPRDFRVTYKHLNVHVSTTIVAILKEVSTKDIKKGKVIPLQARCGPGGG